MLLSPKTLTQLQIVTVLCYSPWVKMTVWFNINNDSEQKERQSVWEGKHRKDLRRLNIGHRPSSDFTPLSSTQGKVSNIERKWGKGRCVKKKKQPSVHVCIYKTGHGHGSSTQIEGGMGESEFEARLST